MMMMMMIIIIIIIIIICYSNCVVESNEPASITWAFQTLGHEGGCCKIWFHSCEGVYFIIVHVVEA